MSQNNIRGLLANHKVIPVINFKTLNEVEETFTVLK